MTSYIVRSFDSGTDLWTPGRAVSRALLVNILKGLEEKGLNLCNESDVRVFSFNEYVGDITPCHINFVKQSTVDKRMLVLYRIVDDNDQELTTFATEHLLQTA